AREEAVTKKIRERCALFKKLLARNKTALELMSELEGCLAGLKQCNLEHIRASSSQISVAVHQMVQSLAALSNGQYNSLLDAYATIAAQIEGQLNTRREPANVALCPYVLPLTSIRLKDNWCVGGKMANLGEISAHLNLKVPDGFAITVSAYDHFMEANDLTSFIAQKMSTADFLDLEAIVQLSQELQQAILQAKIPADLSEAIVQELVKLAARQGRDCLLALRSSAVGEDSVETTYAGQYRSELNVPFDEALHVWKEIVASKYALSAMSYRFQHGIPDDLAPMCVGVLPMVQAKSGGVAYSRDPVRGWDTVVINAVSGLPQGVVDGGTIPDVYTIQHQDFSKVEKRPAKETCVITDSLALRLAKVTMQLEEYYNNPQDVEWAVNAEDELIILQSRPLLVEENVAESLKEEKLDSALQECLLFKDGIPASPGVGMGAPYIVRKQADMLQFPDHAILVCERAYPTWAALLPRCSGLISEAGGTAGHLASVAREYKIPAIFSVTGACASLANFKEITVDAARAMIFQGFHPELVKAKKEESHDAKESEVYQRLAAVAKFITPLHLLDPNSADFKPENCTSLHDIIRFCHEKSVGLLFFSEDTQGEKIGKQLRSNGVKLQYWVVDMGGAVTKRAESNFVDIKEIVNLPMLSLWEGMVKIPWAGPPSVGAAGFMSVVLQSTMNPELESTAPSTMTDRNFFILDDHYMILQARYGYHFSTVEGQITDRVSENFVTFQFKGGAADLERRILRVDMIASLLEEFQFRVDRKEDALFAMAEGFSRENTAKRIALLGYLLIHSRQSDTIMLEVERAKVFKAKLLQDMHTLMDGTLDCIA
ncbi:MAG: phosphoenolpyruvate synthase, partial [Desulfovibrio sp.]|nr:phosphoenolpyruvate synthase [Desulfovibrio sp.]